MTSTRVGVGKFDNREFTLTIGVSRQSINLSTCWRSFCSRYRGPNTQDIYCFRGSAHVKHNYLCNVVRNLEYISEDT